MQLARIDPTALRSQPWPEAAAPPPFDADAYVEQASRLVGLRWPRPIRPGVAANMALIARMADLVMGLPAGRRGRAGAGVRAGRSPRDDRPLDQRRRHGGADPQRCACPPSRSPRRRWHGSRPRTGGSTASPPSPPSAPWPRPPPSMPRVPGARRCRRWPACPTRSRTCSTSTGVVTTAGSKIERDKPPAGADAFLVGRMRAAGAVCVGALNMDEYAYGFTTENAHDGPCHNPHDLDALGRRLLRRLRCLRRRRAWCRSRLGSDTNGSIRVPASLCGIFGLKPTYGRLARTGTYPFVASLDHLGPFARDVADLAAAWDALQGSDPADPAQGRWPVEAATPVLRQGIDGLRIAVADDYFARNGHARGVRRGGRRGRLRWAPTRRVTVPEAARARAAAFLITAAEGANLHLPDLRTRPQDFDPGTRDRLPGRQPDPRHLGRPGAAPAGLVPRADAGAVPRGRRDPGPGHALCRAQAGSADDRGRRRDAAGAADAGRLHPADLVHRPAGPGGAGAAAGRPADRRAADRGTRARGRPVPGRRRARALRRRAGAAAHEPRPRSTSPRWWPRSRRRSIATSGRWSATTSRCSTELFWQQPAHHPLWHRREPEGLGRDRRLPPGTAARSTSTAT